MDKDESEGGGTWWWDLVGHGIDQRDNGGFRWCQDHETDGSCGSGPPDKVGHRFGGLDVRSQLVAGFTPTGVYVRTTSGHCKETHACIMRATTTYTTERQHIN